MSFATVAAVATVVVAVAGFSAAFSSVGATVAVVDTGVGEEAFWEICFVGADDAEDCSIASSAAEEGAAIGCAPECAECVIACVVSAAAIAMPLSLTGFGPAST